MLNFPQGQSDPVSVVERKEERNMKVDVTLLTLNSVKPRLQECLYSLSKEIPVSRLIVVDGAQPTRLWTFVESIFLTAK